jgi:hypothetical protein
LRADLFFFMSRITVNCGHDHASEFADAANAWDVRGASPLPPSPPGAVDSALGGRQESPPLAQL